MSLMAILSLGLAAPAAEVRGVIVKVDPKNHEVVIEARGRGMRGREFTFVLSKETEFRRGKETAREADLSPGERIRVVYENDPGNRRAVRVTIQGAALAELAKPAPANDIKPGPSDIRPGPNDIKPGPNDIKPGPNDANTVSGVLRRVALTDREIVVVGPNPAGRAEKENTIFVPESAKITKDQKPIRLDDLKEGEQVTVQIEKDAHEIAAKSIQVGAMVANPKMTNPGPRGDRIEKARRILQIIDGFLSGMDRP
jgi:cold shock CspA family protein